MTGHNVTRETGAIIRDGRRGTSHGEVLASGVRGQWSKNGFAIPCRGLGQLAAAASYPTVANPQHGHGERPNRESGLLDATCWCDRTVVKVTPEDVRAGRTKSCGRRGCAP